MFVKDEFAWGESCLPSKVAKCCFVNKEMDGWELLREGGGCLVASSPESHQCLVCADDMAPCLHGSVECVITEFAACYLRVEVTCSLLSTTQR